MRILVVNAGSSSLKLRVVGDNDRLEFSGDLAAPEGRADAGAISRAIESFPRDRIDAVGHRIVHGGTIFVRPVIVDGDTVVRLQSLTDLAPLHQPKSLAALEAVSAAIPNVPAVACFDTAFHSTIPAAAHTYALPPEWRRRWGLRRFGFHGLSHSYVSRRAAAHLDRPLDTLRLVICHLGAGASVAAVQHGRSVDTTMGFTPLEGLVMATRSGSVDPGLVLWLEQHAGMPPAQLAATLEHRSGLLGLAGSSDMRSILAGVDRGEADATLALGVYLHRLRAAIAAMAASMGGLDGLVFTGGVGENAPRVRAAACEPLGFLGIAIEDGRNQGGGDHEIGKDDVPVRTLVIQSREDLEIARLVRALLRP